jgi:hypothetical protein
MSLKQYSQSTSDKYDENVDVIITANGSRDLSRAAFRGGALIGYESGNGRPPNEIPVEFIDWPFLKDDVSFEDHLETVKRERPLLAVAPDIEDESEVNETISKADQLAEYAEIVIVVPKAVKPSEIPDRFRVGIPAQERFGGVPWPLWEYLGCGDVHILGGSPKKQREISNYLEEVASVDSASAAKAAKFGSVWMGDSWKTLNTNYYDRIEKSMKNSLKMWNSEIDDDRLREIHLRIEAPDPVRHSGDVTVASASPDISTPSREEMCLAGDDETPFPGRAYFEQRNAPSYREWLN